MEVGICEWGGGRVEVKREGKTLVEYVYPVNYIVSTPVSNS